MSQIYRTQIKVRFGDADPAQIMYFGNVFDFAHTCFEEFIVAAGYTWAEWFRPTTNIVPIRRAEADYLAPFRPGEVYDVDVFVAQIRETSFQMGYRFSQEGRPHGEVKMVHAVLDRQMRKVPLPAEMRARLEPFLAEVPRG